MPCALCGSRIKLDREKTRFMETEISERKSNLDEIRKRINEYEKTLKVNIEDLRKKKEEQIQSHRDLERLRREVNEKFLPRVVSINREMGKIEAEIFELFNLKKNTSEIIERKSSNELEIKILKYFEKVLRKYLFEENSSKEAIKKHMEKYMREFLEIAIISGFENVDLYLMEPRIDSIKFEKLPAGTKVRASMALYYGLLMMGLEHNGRLPCFLIIDSPRQHEMQEDFLGIVKAYSKLDESNGKEVQVIIASADSSIKAATSDSSKVMEFEGRILRDKISEGSENDVRKISDNSGIVKSEKVSAIQTRLDDMIHPVKEEP